MMVVVGLFDDTLVTVAALVSMVVVMGRGVVGSGEKCVRERK